MTSTGRPGAARQSVATWSSRATPFALAIIILLAFGLRLWGLTETSLWYDETFILHHAQRGAVEAVRGLLAEDNALPLYGLLLTLWTRVAGFSEFSVRVLSVFLGTLGVPLVMQLGRAVTQRRTTGLGAGLVYTFLPIFIYYSQEVRMYALALPLAAAFLWAGWRLVAGRRARAAYVVLGWLMLAAHPYAILAWLVNAVWGTLSASPDRDGRRRHGWWKANLLLAALAAPIGMWALWRVRIDATAVSAIPVAALRWLPALYGVGQYLEPPWSGLFIAISALSLITTLTWATREAHRGDEGERSQGRVLTWFLISLTLPIIALFVLTLIKAKWSERYLLPSWGIGLAIAIGTGWELLTGAVRRAAGRNSARSRSRLAIAVALTLVAAWLALATVATGRQAEGTWALAIRDEWHPRPDFRGVAHAIEAHDAPDDTIVVVGGYATSALDFYYQGEATLFGMPTSVQVLDTSRALTMADLGTLERQVASTSQRLWLVLWQDNLADPTGVIQSVLVEQCRRLPIEERFTNVGLLLFDVSQCRPLDRLSEPEVALRVAFEAPIVLQGYRILPTGETWEVNLWWEAVGELEDDYGVFVHLIRLAGTAPTGAMVSQHDHIAGADAYPTSAWREGVVIRDRFFLTVPEGRCRDCQLQVGLYVPDGRLLRTDGADVTVIPIPPELQ